MTSVRRKLALVLPFVLLSIAAILTLVFLLAPLANLDLGIIRSVIPNITLVLVLAELFVAFIGWTVFSLYKVATARNPVWWKALWIGTIILGIFINSLGGLVYFVFGDWERVG